MLAEQSHSVHVSLCSEIYLVSLFVHYCISWSVYPLLINECGKPAQSHSLS